LHEREIGIGKRAGRLDHRERQHAAHAALDDQGHRNGAGKTGRPASGEGRSL